MSKAARAVMGPAILITLFFGFTAGPAQAWDMSQAYPWAAYYPVQAASEPFEESSLLHYRYVYGDYVIHILGAGSRDGTVAYSMWLYQGGVLQNTAMVQAPSIREIKSPPSIAPRGYGELTNEIWTAFGFGADTADAFDGGGEVGKLVISQPVASVGARAAFQAAYQTIFSWYNQDNFDGIERPASADIAEAGDRRLGVALKKSLNEVGAKISNGVPEGIFGSIIQYDIDNDGQLEVIYGSWDHFMYVKRMDGSMYPGNWPYNFHDTCWSTPVVGDIDQDGQVEILTGSDITGGELAVMFNGGRLFMFDPFGNPKHNWPYNSKQTFYSSPAVADLDNDGDYEVISGTGRYWENQGKHVLAFDAQGNLLPGFPAEIGGYITANPIAVDIDNNGSAKEIIVGAWDGKLYCINLDGSIRWATELADRENNTFTSIGDGETGAIRSEAVVADIDGDGDLEVAVAYLWEIVTLDHNGNQLTGPFEPGGRVYVTLNSVFGAPVIADIDEDGFMELACASGRFDDGMGYFYAWDLPAPATAAAPWPMGRLNAQRNAMVTIPQ